MTDLSVTYLGLELANPLVPSASPLSKSLDSARHLEDAGASALVMYSLFEEQILAEERHYDRFMDNQSLGHGEADSFMPDLPDYRGSLDTYLEQLSSLKRSLSIPVIASLNGVTNTGWIEYGKELQEAGADGLELNIYYVAADPLESGHEVEQRYLEVLNHLRRAVTIPIAVKLSPQFSSPIHIINHMQQAGADGVVIFNRFYQSDINLENLEVEPSLELSSSYESLLRVRWAAMIRGALDIDIATTGGFHQSTDIIKALLAGANIVQLCSILLQSGPQRLQGLLGEMGHWLEENEYDSVRQLQGSLSYRHAADPAAYERENYLSVLEGFTPPPGVRY